MHLLQASQVGEQKPFSNGHELVAVQASELLEQPLAFGRELDEHGASVLLARALRDVTGFLAAGYERDGAVVLRL